MSSIKLAPNASGTGIFSIEAPNSSTNRTLTLPDATGTVQVSGNPISGTTASFSGDVTLGSSVLATPSGSAPSYLCRAWVNFNGSSGAINASGNVSSITDNPDSLGAGNYRINFTTSMPDAAYSAVVGPSSPGNTGGLDKIISQNSSGCNFFHYTGSNVGFDHTNFSVAIFR